MFNTVYFPAGGIMIGNTIGMSRGPFPSPNLMGRKNLALLTRRERTSSLSVSVCLKLRCNICVSGYRVTILVGKVTPWSPCKYVHRGCMP